MEIRLQGNKKIIIVLFHAVPFHCKCTMALNNRRKNRTQFEYVYYYIGSMSCVLQFSIYREFHAFTKIFSCQMDAGYISSRSSADQAPTQVVK